MMVNMGENSHHVAVSTYSLLLLVACMIGGTFHTAVAQTETPSAAPTPPADDTGSDQFPSPDPTTILTDAEILRFERAAAEDMGTYNIVFTTTTDYTHCRIRGFYDAKNLTTHTLITNCFNELSNQVEAQYAQGVTFYSDDYYYPTAMPYCAIKCFPITDTSSAFAVSSKQLSIVSAAAASMVFIALAHL